MRLQTFSEYDGLARKPISGCIVSLWRIPTEMAAWHESSLFRRYMTEGEGQRQTRDHETAIQKSSTGKREALQKAVPRKKQKRSTRDTGSASRMKRTPTPPRQINTHSRIILRSREH
ncbi:hypothetical protein EJ05DRAFT_481215 [Pseudovirgaria hyperparasitica]|uniref:Uncharacterized protein n=1 Tax=Pseudovirgaria hyperparasitica TaxID=470096 RepID=A0A6A6VTG3_9PEZI|nr:uncharacterized protein EJ05DRAFT_481215 [Pseudovirgaria hyperparasitica]KAF2752527.1 hypothetical protein EJ05DRAFT_481215 [Pseudovirgaria hyperparasitica]